MLRVNLTAPFMKLLTAVFFAWVLGGCSGLKPEQTVEAEPTIQKPTQYKVGREITLATRPTEENGPVASWDGKNYLVVWQDQREGNFDIYGKRVSPEGKVLDQESFAISTESGDQIKPGVLWNGSFHLVVWQDRRNGPNWEIYGARVTPSGEVLDPQGLPISVGGENRGTPSLAWNGKAFFVVWEKENPQPFMWDVYGARISSEGKVLDPDGIEIIKAPGDQFSCGISWNGKSFLAAWSDKRSGSSFDIYGTLLNSKGKVKNPQGFLISEAPGDQFYPSVSWNGEVHLVVWMDKRNEETQIYGSRVGAKGEVLEPEGIPISGAQIFHSFPTVISKGKEFLVAWDMERKTTYKDVYAARVNSKGIVLDKEGLSIYNSYQRQAHAHTATDGNRYLVVWEDERAGLPFQGDIYGQLVDLSGNIPALTEVSDSDEHKLGPYIIHQISVHPQDPRRVYAATSHYGILKSEDRGAHWTLINQGLKSYTHHQLVVHPGNPDILYAGAWGGGVSRSADGGKTWQEVNAHLGDTAVNAIALHPSDPNKVYVATESGIFRTLTGGTDWESMNQGLRRNYDETFESLALVQADPDVLFLGSTQGLYQWDGNSGKWLLLKQAQGERVTSLLYEPKQKALFVGTADGNLSKTRDGGKTWDPIGTGLLGITDMAVDSQNPDTLYLSTVKRGVLKTVDGGKTWEEKNKGLPKLEIPSIAIDPLDTQTLYVGTSQSGILRTYNGGETWAIADSIPELTITEVLRSIPEDHDMRSPKEIRAIIASPGLAREVFPPDSSGMAPPPEFVKCNGCHGWTDPLLSIRKTYWRVPTNIRDWKFTVKERMGMRAGLTPNEEESVIQFLDRYTKNKAGESSPSVPLPAGPLAPTGSSLLREGHREETPSETVKRICGQCHGLKINGQCVAGNCQGARVHDTPGRQWDIVVDWMRTMGAKINDQEQRSITEHLTQTYPGKPYPLNWTKVMTIPDGGWNITSLESSGNYIYAGLEGNGKIFRSPDGDRWEEVGDTQEYRVYGITKFKGAYFAGTDTPQPEIWRSPDGQKWEKSAVLPSDQAGIISLGTFKDHLYAGTARGRVYRSPDGKSWTLSAVLKELAGPHWVRFIIEFKGNLYVGTEHAYLYQSPDGQTWNEMGQEIRKDRKALGYRGVAVFKDRLYIGTTGAGEIWCSENGKKWTLCFDSTPGKESGYVASMAVANGFLYAGIRTHSGFVFRTRDGTHWEEVGNLSPHTIEAMSVFKEHLYAGTLIPPAANIYRAFLNNR